MYTCACICFWRNGIEAVRSNGSDLPIDPTCRNAPPHRGVESRMQLFDSECLDNYSNSDSSEVSANLMHRSV